MLGPIDKIHICNKFSFFSTFLVLSLKLGCFLMKTCKLNLGSFWGSRGSYKAGGIGLYISNVYVGAINLLANEPKTWCTFRFWMEIRVLFRDRLIDYNVNLVYYDIKINMLCWLEWPPHWGGGGGQQWRTHATLNEMYSVPSMLSIH